MYEKGAYKAGCALYAPSLLNVIIVLQSLCFSPHVFPLCLSR